MGNDPANCLLPPASILNAALLAGRLVILHSPVIFFSLATAGLLMPRAGKTDRCLAAAIIYFTAATVAPWVLPLSYSWLLGWSLLLGVIGMALRMARKKGSEEDADGTGSLLELFGPTIVVLFALVLFAIAVFKPWFDHDALTYQLHFPGEWINAGRITLVPTPFGDPSQAYSPALASVYYLWLMLPLGNDMAAAAGGWFFLPLLLLASAGLARELGCRAAWSFTAPLFALTSPFLVHEASAALSDIAVAAFLAASVYFFLRALRERNASRLFFALLALGLMIGSKYSGAIYLLLLIPLAVFSLVVVRGRGTVWAWLVGIVLGAVAGGGWYIRNIATTGNPLYPIRFPGLDLPALYGRDEMLGWVFHRQGFSAWLKAVEANASLPALVLFAAAVICLALVKAQEARKAGDESLLLALAALWTAIFALLVDRMNWHLVPYQEPRFWIAAAPFAAAAAAAVFSRRWWAAGLAVLVCYLGLYARGRPDSLFETVSMRRIMLWLPASAFAALVFARAVKGSPGAKECGEGKPGFPASALLNGRVIPVLAALFFLVVIAAGLRGYYERRADALSRFPFARAWEALPCPADGMTVAYTGANTPYPLHGPRLKNKVVYVAPSGMIDPLPHQAMEELGDDPPRFMTPEPAPSSIELCPRGWAEAVVRSAAEYLVVTRIGVNELVNHPHSKDGWPLEEGWAGEAPSLFRPVYKGRYARVYWIDRAAGLDDAALPGGCTRRPADAYAAAYVAGGLEGFFPRAGELMPSLGEK